MAENQTANQKTAKTVKKGDFVELEYGGKLEDGTVFDTTNLKIAKENDLYDSNRQYGPLTVCVGEGHLIAGVDKSLEGKKVGDNYKIELSPEDGFGKKNIKLIQLVSAAKFKKQGVDPMPGMQVNIDGMFGIIKKAGGGRILVDFNHPLAGRNLTYHVQINRIVTDNKEKVRALVNLKLSIKDAKAEIKHGKAVITTEKDLGLPAEVQNTIKDEVSNLVPSVKDLEFKTEKKDDSRFATIRSSPKDTQPTNKPKNNPDS